MNNASKILIVNAEVSEARRVTTTATSLQTHCHSILCPLMYPFFEAHPPLNIEILLDICKGLHVTYFFCSKICFTEKILTLRRVVWFLKMLSVFFLFWNEKYILLGTLLYLDFQKFISKPYNTISVDFHKLLLFLSCLFLANDIKNLSPIHPVEDLSTQATLQYM